MRSLGWVEIPEEDLAPGKSSIAVNNCIQQLSQSKCESLDPAGSWGEVSLSCLVPVGNVALFVRVGVLAVETLPLDGKALGTGCHLLVSPFPHSPTHPSWSHSGVHH